MGKFFSVLALSFIVLFFTNVTFLIINIFFWATNGLQTLLFGKNFIEILSVSIYLKWILLADSLWIIAFTIFLFKRRRYKVNPVLHYLSYKPITNPKICVAMCAYNEEQAIEKVVKDFISQKHVDQVIVVDNNSTDRTVEIAKKCGAKVITKGENKGYSHSWIMTLKESLKTDANVIAVVDTDGTYNGYDISKMLPYLDNCDMVVGTRMVQALTEKGNQNDPFLVWGNSFIAKLLQIKYFSFEHLGVVQLTDVGCSYRLMRREALEKIIDKFTQPGTDMPARYFNDHTLLLFTTVTAIENDLRIVEIPITFNKRIGKSKTMVTERTKAIAYGLKFIWYIIKS
jgi:glycosyltransferase involved in cell wall biosynthesis